MDLQKNGEFPTLVYLNQHYSCSRPPVPLGVGGLHMLYADPALCRACVLPAVPYRGPSRAGSQVVSSVYPQLLF